jgi:hypothetical protein
VTYVPDYTNMCKWLNTKMHLTHKNIIADAQSGRQTELWYQQWSNTQSSDGEYQAGYEIYIYIYIHTHLNEI